MAQPWQLFIDNQRELGESPRSSLGSHGKVLDDWEIVRVLVGDEEKCSRHDQLNALFCLSNPSDGDAQREEHQALLPFCQVSKIYPEGHFNKVWWNFVNSQDRIWQESTITVFGFLLQNRWEQRYTADMSTLQEFRHRIMMPFIHRGLDVNLRIVVFHSWNQ